VGICHQTLLVALGLELAACGAAPAPVAKSSSSNRVTYRYCGGTVTEHEVHRCIYQLTQEQQRRRGYSQRLVFEDGKFVRYEEVNGLGILQDGTSRFSVSVFSYEGDRISGWVNRSRNGVDRGGVRVSQDGARIEWLDEKGRPRVQEGTRASGFLRKLDARGRVLAYTYVDAHGNPTPSSDGRIEVRTKRNDAGALLEQSYFDQQGAAMRDNHGVHRDAFTVDDRGIDVKHEYFDERGTPAANKDGVHRLERQWDDVGNLIGQAHYGLDGRPVRSKASDAASYRLMRDEHGSEVSRTYFDEYGAPTLSKYGYVTRRVGLDERGDEIQWSAHGIGGQPIPFGPKMHSIMRSTRDERGNAVLERFFDDAGRPMLIETGYHATSLAYDERDNVLMGTYLDEALQPKVTSSFYTTWRYRYDGDRRTSTQYFSAQDQLVDIGWGYAEKRKTFDELGAEGVTTYHDARGRDVASPDACPRYGSEDQLPDLLQPVFDCAQGDRSPGAAVVLQLDAAGRLQSSAFVGLTNMTVRECLEDKLSRLVLPPAGQECAKATAFVRFADRNIFLVPRRAPAVPVQAQSLSTWLRIPAPTGPVKNAEAFTTFMWPVPAE
jgi:hypothetical protein